MHKTKTRLLAIVSACLVRPVRAVVSVAVRPAGKPSISAKTVRSMTVAVHLMGIAAVVAIPAPRVHVKTALCQTVSGVWTDDYVFNFITAEGQYFMLADGRVLFVKEE